MRDILQAAQLPLLERLARGRTLLAFDYDGVLAPLVVKDPMGAPMRPVTRRLLARLALAWPCAVVSGRSWAHTRRLSQGAVPLIVGNHGFELGRARRVPDGVRAQVRGWRDALERGLAGVAGIHYEDKDSTLSVHFGLGRRWRAAGAAVHREAARLGGARLVAGKKVLNVIPDRFPDKGDAIRTLLARLRLDAALYVGDDVTDEDAFAVGMPTVVGVHVGRGPSRAPFRLSSQDRIDDLLRALTRLRPAPGRAGEAPAPPRRARSPRGAARARAR